jgi:hypothetical protein
VNEDNIKAAVSSERTRFILRDPFQHRIPPQRQSQDVRTPRQLN